ncbi:hypothetical protein ABLE91_26885 [Aquabacter sp. CN5-332]|uniref:hypothetical protein n=1 Tax=Aquabacter sp. CN5-332 TaxID=3156608 RepID=UPI0032B47D64
MDSSSLKQQAHQFADEKKEQGAERIDGFADAIRGAARSLEEEMPMGASYIDSAAEQLERAAAALKGRSVEQLLGDMENLTRGRPLVLFGGAVVAGFALTRFLKSSAPAPARELGRP